MRRRTTALWLASSALWVGFAAAMPRAGESLLRRIHFEHPDARMRSRALVIRAVHVWERAAAESPPNAESLRAASDDLAEADRLRPLSPELQELRSEIDAAL